LTPVAALLLVTLAAWVVLMRLDMMASRPVTFLAGWPR
jgi:hypothetical protein